MPDTPSLTAPPSSTPDVPAPTTPADAGYAELARTGRRWRRLAGALVLIPLGPVLFVLAFLAGCAVAWAAGAEIAPDETPTLFANPLWDEAAGLVAVASLIPAVLLVAVVVERRSVGSLLSVTGRLRLRWLGCCALVAAPLLGVALATLVVLDDGPPLRFVGAGPLAVAVLVLVPSVILQSAAEELLARGWLLQAVGSVVRSPWPGILVGGAVWTALHVPTTWWGVADLMLFSAVAGWLTVRTGGLEAAIALHAVVNLTVFLLLGAVGGLGESGSAGDAGWPQLLLDGLVLPVYAVAVLTLHRRFRLATYTAGAPQSAEGAE